MKELRVFSLYSGSTGNAFLITCPRASILIDAGKNAKRLSAALAEVGIAPEALCAIFLTHEHNDHISALSVFLKKHHLPVHLPERCASKLETDPAIAPHLFPHSPIHEETVGPFHIASFPTPHDSHGSVGYRITYTGEGGDVVCIGYATDIGHISREVEQGLMGCDAVILESNHDPEMLANGVYPYVLKERIFSRRGHLSNPDSAVFAARLCENGTKSLMLAHLSLENNTPSLAFNECFSAVSDERVCICVADPEGVTEMKLDPIKEVPLCSN